MTNNFTPKKSGTAARPQLSPEEYAAKKKAEKDAVYQMIDDTAAEIVSDPDKFRAYLDTQARMDRYSAANALWRSCLLPIWGRSIRTRIRPFISRGTLGTALRSASAWHRSWVTLSLQ